MLKDKVTINLHVLIVFNNVQQVSSFYEDSIVLSLLSLAFKKIQFLNWSCFSIKIKFKI